MKTTALPSVFPAEDTFESSSIHVDLSCVTSNAVIHYTIDGSHPPGLLPKKWSDTCQI